MVAGYVLKGPVSEATLDALRAMLPAAEWTVTDCVERKYSTWFPLLTDVKAIPELAALFPNMSTAFFLRIPPRGYVHKHVDVHDTETYHVPVETNAGVTNVMYEPERKEYHLEIGKVYRVQRAVEHESFNTGDTNRTHLLIEVR